jgi:hypothetical protein
MQRRIACLAWAVRDKALCKVLSPPELAKFNARAYRKHYPVGQLITGPLSNGQLTPSRSTNDRRSTAKIQLSGRSRSVDKFAETAGTTADCTSLCASTKMWAD